MIAADDDIPRADDLDPDEVPPYRRRPKAVPVRRTRFPRLARVMRIAAWVLFVLLPGVYAGYRVVIFARTSPLFRLMSAADVDVVGGHYVVRDEVLAALGIPGPGIPWGGVNIFRFSLENARRQVEGIAWVRSAALERSYPHHLMVRITERTPVAFVNVGGRIKLADGDGVLLDLPEKASFDFPVLTGVGPGLMPADRQARMQLYLDFMGKVSGEAGTSGWMVSEVDLTDVDDLKAVVVRGPESISLEFGHEDFDERFRNFLTLLDTERGLGENIASMDLRYQHQVVVNRAAPTAAPAQPADPAPAVNGNLARSPRRTGPAKPATRQARKARN